ncbi:MAG: cytochrome-c oxidase, cbb3-type subunit III [Pseudomonadota bacterium]
MMSNFWSLWIVVLTIANLILILWVLMANRKLAVVDEAHANNGESGGTQTDAVSTTGHVYDGIEEYNNPLPRWWFYMFIATMIYAVGYLIVYPGLGAYQGLSVGNKNAWTSASQLKAEQFQAQAQYEATFGEFAKAAIPELANNATAMKMGYRLFLNNCALCHGADGSGNQGYPNLTDKDWLYGGSPDQIKQSIVQGRKAMMPAWGATLGEAKIANVAEFVLALSGREHDQAKAKLGMPLFATNCAACHGADGKGVQQLGAPNLTDAVWLYGGEPNELRQTLRQGRSGVMPAHEQMLKPERIHLLAAYVYSLSIDAAAQ